MKYRITEKQLKILGESRIVPDDLKESNIFLFIKGMDYVLYSPKMDKVFATISLSRLKSGNYFVSGVAAEYGYGPIIYEIAMSNIYPNGLLPTRDGDIRQGSINVWNKFLKREDIKKEFLKPDDKDFSEEYDEEFGSGGDLQNIVQTRFYYSGLNDFIIDLKRKGEETINSSHDLDNIIQKGEDFWLDKYQ
jgi:hypothetical protein